MIIHEICDKKIESAYNRKIFKNPKKAKPEFYQVPFPKNLYMCIPQKKTFFSWNSKEVSSVILQ